MKRHFLLLIFLLSSFLTACQSTPPVDLSPERQAELKNQIAELETQLDQTPKGEIPDHLALIDLARDYQELGQPKKALRLYENYLKQGYSAQVILHNLGHLNEDMGQYEKAVTYYQQLVDEYKLQDYLYDIAWAHVRAKDLKKAQSAYDTLRLTTNRTDLQLEDELSKLRQDQ